MVRFFGKVGYAHPIEVQNGTWEDQITERTLYGDVERNTRRLASGEYLNNDLTVGNSISVLADSYANENVSAIRYVEWAGALWTVTEVEVQSPRLTLRLGGKYNGPTPASGSS